MKILVTGAAGFIGYHLSSALLSLGHEVFGLDNLNEYYDINLKKSRLSQLQGKERFCFEKIDLTEKEKVDLFFQKYRPEYVVNLAAQAGVRYSLINPYAYTESNVTGFLNILEACRKFPVNHLVYASSSSVYGLNAKMPFSIHDNVDHPVSLYAASKKSNELFAHTYSHLYEIPTTGLRFFTVYGPWGRPDMALFIFTKAILEEKPIDVFNNGLMRRDFTFIDDIVEGIIRLLSNAPEKNPNWDRNFPDPGTSIAPYKVYNIGNHSPVELLYLIEILENALGKKAKKNFLPIQPGDVAETFADVDDLIKDVGFCPATPIEEGVNQFVRWYKEFYRV